MAKAKSEVKDVVTEDAADPVVAPAPVATPAAPFGILLEAPTGFTAVFSTVPLKVGANNYVAGPVLACIADASVTAATITMEQLEKGTVDVNAVPVSMSKAKAIDLTAADAFQWIITSADLDPAVNNAAGFPA